MPQETIALVKGKLHEAGVGTNLVLGEILLAIGEGRTRAVEIPSVEPLTFEQGLQRLREDPDALARLEDEPLLLAGETYTPKGTNRRMIPSIELRGDTLQVSSYPADYVRFTPPEQRRQNYQNVLRIYNEHTIAA